MARLSYLRSLTGRIPDGVSLLRPPRVVPWGRSHSGEAQLAHGESSPEAGAVNEVSFEAEGRSTPKESAAWPQTLSPPELGSGLPSADSNLIAAPQTPPLHPEHRPQNPARRGAEFSDEDFRSAQTHVPSGEPVRPAAPVLPANNHKDSRLSPAQSFTLRPGQYFLERSAPASGNAIKTNARQEVFAEDVVASGNRAETFRAVPQALNAALPSRAPATAPKAAESPAGRAVHIGTIDIHVTAPAPSPKPQPAARATTPAGAMSRGFTSSFGLTQG
jgi:hypothetical protein